MVTLGNLMPSVYKCSMVDAATEEINGTFRPGAYPGEVFVFINKLKGLNVRFLQVFLKFFTVHVKVSSQDDWNRWVFYSDKVNHL